MNDGNQQVCPIAPTQYRPTLKPGPGPIDHWSIDCSARGTRASHVAHTQPSFFISSTEKISKDSDLIQDSGYYR
eukprot:scaffold167392_cov31-Tisochrysis_lutea.AAC.4